MKNQNFAEFWINSCFGIGTVGDPVTVEFKDGRIVEYTTAILDLLKSDPDVDHVMLNETGELLYWAE